MQTELKENDVAVILRPQLDSEGNWDESFEVLVTGFGPITMKKEDFDSLLGIGTLLAAVVPFMEQSIDNAQMLLDWTKEYYGEDVMDFDYNLDHDSFKDDDESVLTINTKTVGGIQ